MGGQIWCGPIRSGGTGRVTTPESTTSGGPERNRPHWSSKNLTSDRVVSRERIQPEASPIEIDAPRSNRAPSRAFSASETAPNDSGCSALPEQRSPNFMAGEVRDEHPVVDFLEEVLATPRLLHERSTGEIARYTLRRHKLSVLVSDSAPSFDKRMLPGIANRRRIRPILRRNEANTDDLLGLVRVC